jgi:hypothetical protein
MRLLARGLFGQKKSIAQPAAWAEVQSKSLGLMREDVAIVALDLPTVQE